MIHIIYMAAGNSRRFGSNKLFYELDGKPMYRHLLERNSAGAAEEKRIRYLGTAQ